jgi:hypothetical protein
MTAVEPQNLFDVDALLHQSLPRRARGGWLLPVAFGVFVMVIAALFVAAGEPMVAPVMRVFAAAAVFGLFVAYGFAGYARSQKVRRDRAIVENLEELVMLRRWPQAAASAGAILSEPMLGHGSRVQALVYLSSILSRYHQFDGAIRVQDYLIEHVEMEGGLALTIRLGRAMAMLRDDRLLDVDRAISELRRFPNADKIAGVALVELYRDVKTGHPNEAVAIYRGREALFGAQLAHRAADAHFLAAKAFSMINDEKAAREAFEKATLLAPACELARRYPEAADLLKKFIPAAAPPEAA